MFIAPFLVPRLDDPDRAPDPRRRGSRGGPRGPRVGDARPRPEGRGVREGVRQGPWPEARDRGIPVIEDAAQAAGAEYHGKKAGNLGDTACFSFYATKNMTTGEGGMIVTDDDRIAERARLLRHHGQPTKYEHVLVGFNYRMTEIAAAIGLAQLAKLDGWVKQRRANARALSKGLDGIEGLVPPSEGNWMVHSYYQYIVRRGEAFPRSRGGIVQG